MSNDHFIAQTYLKNFGDPNKSGMLHAYRKSKKDPFDCWPKNICHEWDGDLNPALSDPDSLGNFRKIFEPHWNSSIANILSNPISNDDKLAISAYMANLIICTPAWRRITKELYEQNLKGHLSFERRMGEKYGGIEDNLNDSIKILEEGKIKLDIDTNYIKGLATEDLLLNTLETYNQDWEIIVNNTHNLFVTSDNPVAIDYSGQQENVLVRFLPINPRLCLCVRYNQILNLKHENIVSSLKLSPRGKIQITEWKAFHIRRINSLVIQCAEDLVLSSEVSETIRALTAKYAKYRVGSDYSELPGEEDGVYQVTRLRIKRM